MRVTRFFDRLDNPNGAAMEMLDRAAIGRLMAA
jgi:hypothetical protein